MIDRLEWYSRQENPGADISSGESGAAPTKTEEGWYGAGACTCNHPLPSRGGRPRTGARPSARDCVHGTVTPMDHTAPRRGGAEPTMSTTPARLHTDTALEAAGYIRVSR